ncbi:hypothetical protein TRFO_32445 [Tritrichomonas foetus]|uniref:Uncharacterized protein n=1 Tax=Tritrichomonas foetus TaxID=1144522 RepID=A0A1J4JQS2_9EUKA|nr:hypothetical protein TRFO_32445 [Tritrichomonas foetus]|eukprot:OHT00760.1 hypothetical protein TRFO_32445 [Tritrichomonas foetus]
MKPKKGHNESNYDQMDLMTLLTNLDLDTVDLIGQNQLDQINMLQIQVNSLENQLASKKEELVRFEKKHLHTVNNINQKVNLIMKSLNPSEKETFEVLQKIAQNDNSFDKIIQFTDFMFSFSKSNSEALNLMSHQLNDHIKLIEQINSNQSSSYAIASPRTLQKIFISQLEKTKSFLNNTNLHMRNNSNNNEGFPTIENSLNLKPLSKSYSFEKLKKVITGFELPNHELKTLLLQEIACVDTLRNYIQENHANKKSIQGNKENGIELTSQFTKEVTPETENRLRVKLEKELRAQIEAEFQFQKLDQSIEHNNNIEKMKFDLENQLKRTIREQTIHECLKQNTKLHSRILNSIRPEIENEIMNKLNKNNTEIQNELMKNNDLFLEDQKKEIHRQFEEEFNQKFKKIEVDLKKNLEFEILQKYKNLSHNQNMQQYRNSQIMNSHQIQDSSGLIQKNEINNNESDGFDDIDLMKELFPKVLEARGIISRHSFSTTDFISQVSLLSNDLIYLRKRFRIRGMNFLKPLIELEDQVLQLDQLHSQTRALLTRQTEVISELRQKTEYNSWFQWAKNIYNQITGYEFKIEENDDITELRSAIEQEIKQGFSRKKGIYSCV